MPRQQPQIAEAVMAMDEFQLENALGVMEAEFYE